MKWLTDNIILFGDVATIFCSSCGDVIAWERPLPVTHHLLFEEHCEHCEPLQQTLEHSKAKVFVAEIAAKDFSGGKTSERRKREATRDAKAAASLLAQRRRVVGSQLSFARSMN